MLHYAVVFLVIALIAALFGFGGIAAGAAEIAKILFVVFLILAAPVPDQRLQTLAAVRGTSPSEKARARSSALCDWAGPRSRQRRREGRSRHFEACT